jgi:hypothetical protein
LYSCGFSPIKQEKAIQVLNKSLEELPLSQIPIDIYFLDYISLYYEIGDIEKGNQLLKELAEDNCQMLKYIYSLTPYFAHTIQREENISIYILQRLLDFAHNTGQKDLTLELKNQVESIYSPFISRQESTQPATQQDSVQQEGTKQE